jgi:hypothetical protein
MTAIVTDDLKFNILSALLGDYNTSGTEYYIGVGRSEIWDSNDAATTPINAKFDIIDFKERLQSVKKVEAASFVVPRQDWTYGTIYPQWDDRRQGSLSVGTRYYVLTDNYGVYICLRTGRNKQGVVQPSLVKPSGNENVDPFSTSDGYVWKFLYTVSALKANFFLSSQYMPVHIQETAPDSNSTGIEIKQWEIQQNAKPGRIISFVMTNGGNGYGTTGVLPNIVIRGNGTLSFGDSATNFVTAVIDSNAGTITAINTNSASGNTLSYLDSYDFGAVTISPDGSGGDSAQARPIIGPTPGFGRDARKDLKANALMFRSKILDVDDDFILSQDFRQIGLIKNPSAGDSAGDFIALTGIASRNIKLSSYTIAFNKDKIIEGVSSGAKAYIDNVDSSVTLGSRLFYHQSPETGFKQFQTGETIAETNGNGEGVIETHNNPGEVDRLSGEVLYLDNRVAVSRTANQSEDIKVIIQL